jgi:hypothetical protein
MTSKKPTFASVRSVCQNKINAFQTVVTQTAGAGAKFRPTPSQLNTFARLIDKGAQIQRVTNSQLNRWAGRNRTWTPGSVKSVLSSKFGRTCIKAVAFNKTGGFIVATTPTRKGRPFRFNS